MSLQIHLDYPYAKPSIYVNGIIISYPETPGMEFQARTLSVRLLGRSKTRIITGNESNAEIHESSATFLEIQTEVYPGPARMVWGDRSSFSFRLPDNLTAPQPDAYEMGWSWNRDRPKPQALPPSGEFGPGNIISYNLEVSMMEESSLSRELSASTALTFSLTREIEAPDPQITTTVQAKTLTNPDEPLNLIYLEIALDIPTIIVQERAFPLILRLRDTKARSGLSPVPAVLLKSSIIQLHENTFVQSKDNTTDNWTNKHTIASHEFCLAESDSRPPAITLKDLDLASLLHNPIIAAHFAPTFACINIQRTYALEISLVLERGGETFEMAYNLGAVTVLAAEHTSEAQAQQEEETEDPWP